MTAVTAVLPGATPRHQKQHKTPEHLRMQPFGQVPVLEIDEQSFIYESRAIANYFERRYPTRGQ